MRKLITILALIISATTIAQTAKDFYNNGNEKANSQDYAGSIKDYDKAIKLDPKYTDAYYNKGASKMYLKDYKGAIKDFNKAIELNAGFVNAYSNRGVAKLQMDDTKGAIEDFDTAIKLDPSNSSAYFMRGQVKLQTGNSEGGCADLTKSKELGDKRADKFISQYCNENKSNESLMIDWPDAEGWKVASNQEDKERKVIELLRNKETFENWTEIGTMMTYPLKNVPVDAAMNAMYEQSKKTCSSAKLTFIEKDDTAKYPWIIFKIECGSKTPESQVWHIIQGTNEMYINFRAVKEKTVPDNLKTKWTAFFKTAKVITQ